jgi:penicillin-binding protein 2
MNLNLAKKRIKFSSLDEIAPEEIFLDSLAQKKENDFFEKKFEVPLSKNISRIFFAFIFVLISVLFINNFRFQVLERDKFLALADGNKFIIQKVRAERGIIYDRNLRQLVFNQPSFDLVAEKSNLPKIEQEKFKILKEVSGIIKKDFATLKKEIEESRGAEILVSENLDYQTLLILETKIRELPGFQIKNNTVRDYLDGEIFSHVLGYKRKTGRTAGLENYYDEALKEKPGEILRERDAAGNLISQKIVSLPESGKSLILTLDSQLQKKIYEELGKALESAGVKVGAAVALDPKTGEVLSLVSFPSFDNNLFSKGMSTKDWELIEKENLLFDNAISGGHQAGSTIKPLLAVAALEEKIISPDKKIDASEGTGKIVIRSRWDPNKFQEFTDWKIHGLTDMRKAIAQSVNVYFYTIGGGYGDQDGLGPSRIKKYLELFGWGNKTQIDLPEEKGGLLPDPEWKKTYFKEKVNQIWYDGDTYNLSIGQGYLKVTPLQMAVSYLPIVNGGKLLKPKLAKGILDSNKTLVEVIKPEVIREGFIKDDNLEVVRQGMRGAVTNGSCTDWLNNLPFPTACKTGTAQTGKFDPADKKNYFNAWTVVFAPYDEPEIVLVIFVKEVKKAHPTVMPVAKSVLEWYFSR